MKNVALVVVAIGLVIATDALEQQRATQTTGSDETTEEPHPYTISFFIFPHGAASQLLEKTMTTKKYTNKHHNHNQTYFTSTSKASPEDTWIENDPDPDSLYPRGSINHPTSEMYPHCHQCAKNSTYEGCSNNKTLKVCNKGLANICFTKSVKSGDEVHYEMGCASHQQCTRARAQPCKPNVKRCFTCCQWSSCNSQFYHHKKLPYKDEITMMSFNNDAVTLVTSWVLVYAGLFLTIYIA